MEKTHPTKHMSLTHLAMHASPAHFVTSQPVLTGVEQVCYVLHKDATRRRGANPRPRREKNGKHGVQPASTNKFHGANPHQEFLWYTHVNHLALLQNHANSANGVVPCWWCTGESLQKARHKLDRDLVPNEQVTKIRSTQFFDIAGPFRLTSWHRPEHVRQIQRFVLFYLSCLHPSFGFVAGFGAKIRLTRHATSIRIIFATLPLFFFNGENDVQPTARRRQSTNIATLVIGVLTFSWSEDRRFG